MARLPYVDPKDLPEPYAGIAFSTANVTRALLNSPASANAFRTMMRHVREGTRLDPKLREMAVTQVGYTMRVPYEYVHHLKNAMNHGATEADIRAIAEESAGGTSHLDPLTRTALKAAREMTLDLKVSDATFKALQHDLEKDQMVDLFLAIAMFNAVIRLLMTLEVDIEEDYLGYLKKFPLPA